MRRHGLLVNHKPVLRLMREDNLLGLRQRGWMRTTDSQHHLVISPNVRPELPADGLEQLWVADMTSVRLPQEFVSLAVILDAYSRRCIGWALERTLEADLARPALRLALAKRAARPGLGHHAERGVQYASHAYTAVLKEYGIRLSMSRTGKPSANAQAESVIKTLKYAAVSRLEYQHQAEGRGRISHFIEEIYHAKRLHSALGYRPPAECERLLGP